MNFNLNVGYYFLGTQCQQQPIDLGQLEVNRAEEESSQLGQWYFQANASEDSTDSNQDNSPKSSEIKIALLDTACRLGLKPVIFTEKFSKVLDQEKPVCLVADTSALHHGYLEQALRLRNNKPTHISIPDQVYMEIQRQRERNKTAKDQKTSEDKTWDCLKERRLRKLQFAPARAIHRLNQAGIIHHIRPPEAMVRYFGAETSDYSNQATNDGTNYHRDRLILEALRQQRQTLPNVPIWLITGDANFAIQVQLEGFNVGFARQPSLSKTQAFIITSPYLEARSLSPYHLPLEVFLEECLWEWGTLTLQKAETATRTRWDLSNNKTCQYVQLKVNVIDHLVDYKIERCQKRCYHPKSSETTNDSMKSVPKRAPPPFQLIMSLEQLDKLSFPMSSYLQALQWIEKIGKSIKLSHRGKEVIEIGSHLSREDVRAWYDWIFKVKQDLKQLDKQIELRKVLTLRQPESDDRLANQLGFSLRDIRSQSILAHAFGLVVRLSGKTWLAEDPPIQEAAQLIFDTAADLTQDKISSAVRVDKVFTTLLTRTPLSVPTFRIGLYELFDSKKIKLGGTVPETGVKVKVLIPQQGESMIDLGTGDFLIPNVSSQVIIIEKTV